MIKKIWDWLNGNKTLIGTLIIVIVNQDGCIFGSCLIEDFLQWLGGVLAGVGVVHKVLKGVNNT